MEQIETLRACLRAGIGRGDTDALLARLHLPDALADGEVARLVVARLDAAEVGSIALGGVGAGAATRREPSRIVGTRSSFLMRLAGGAEDPGVDIALLGDLRTLQAVLRAGNLQQRRAAALRLGELLADPKGQAAEHLRPATHLLLHLRRWDLAYELSQACAGLPGADGRRARAGRKEWDKLADQMEADILRYWDGLGEREPIHVLHGDQRAQLLSRTRDLSDVVLRHLCAIIEGTDGGGHAAGRAALVHALRNAADTRLLASLRAVLVGNDTELALAAGRALARIDDPRVQPLLRMAYERAVSAVERLTLAGALGLAGDKRGLGYVRGVLAEDDAALLPAALDALRYTGTSDDVQRVTELLVHDDPLLVVEAVKSLARIGDGRALLPLARLRGETDRSALRAEIEEASIAIEARMELLGEEAPSVEAAVQTFDTTKMAAMAKRRDPAAVRARARWCLIVGSLWRAIGASMRAIGRFEEAAALRPDWALPVMLVAMVHARFEEYPQALAAFRRALELDRDYVEGHSSAARMLAQAFLRRAETVDRQGRSDVARALLEEALALDLRKAPSGLRFALTQRHETMRGGR